LQTLKAITESVFEQIYPNSTDETPVDKDIFYIAARSSYAYYTWLNYLKAKNETGEKNVPSNLITPITLPIVDNKVDISNIGALTALPNNVWLQTVGGGDCGDCSYDIMDLNTWKKLCNDPSRNTNSKAVVVYSSQLQFKEGVFDGDTEVLIEYASMGSEDLDDIYIDEAMGKIVRTDLLKEFSAKFAEDKTNDSNSNL
jgi:hypothetical protein